MINKNVVLLSVGFVIGFWSGIHTRNWVRNTIGL